LASMSGPGVERHPDHVAVQVGDPAPGPGGGAETTWPTVPSRFARAIPPHLPMTSTACSFRGPVTAASFEEAADVACGGAELAFPQVGVQLWVERQVGSRWAAVRFP
jgi:hypothetical protein